MVGRRARTSRSIRSEAPFPHSTQSSGTPSRAEMARLRPRQRGQDRRESAPSASRAAWMAQGGTPKGFRLMDRSSTGRSRP